MNYILPRIKAKIEEAKEKQLKELDLSYNGLTSLPESISKLTNLT